jgi:preprotein translocase subunit SecA
VLKLLTSIFGSRNQRLLRQYGKLVAAANALDDRMRAVPDEGYPALTAAFKERLAKGETLDDLLPEAFAAVREAARRTIGLRHFDVQLVGGIALHQGKIAEMRTGEGKTLVATLPVYLNALAGKGVHVVTVNDYLASRDAEWMAPVYRFLGFTVGVIRAGQSQDEKRAAYACDITYGTNNEYGFDYLRDNLAFRLEDRVQRGLQFAIVDEVDSILIDEARTPLIISGPAEESTELYLAINKLVPRLTRAAAEETADAPVGVYVATISASTFGGNLHTGDVILKANGAPVSVPADVANALASGRGGAQKGAKDGAGRVELEVWRERELVVVPVTLPADGKVMVEGQGTSMVVQGATLRVIGDAERERLGVGGDYWVDLKQKQVHLTEVGHHTIEQLFAEAGLLQGGGSLYDAGNIRLMHHLNAALRAHAIYHKDIEYIVRNDEVIIVDEFTGRTMPGRRWSDGLHQAVEAKEGVEVREENQTIASVTFQNYFRMYGKLAGMTGTADTEAYEFQQIYGLEVVVIPTHRPMVRKDHSDLVYLTQQDKFDAIVEDIRDCIAREQPVLVGTASIEASELLSGLLKKQNIPHEVLNAKQHEREAQIVAQAGRPGAVTIATNMAGRGTDIVLGGRPEAADPLRPDDAATVQQKHADWQARHAKVTASGGLHIIGTERHESRRIDNQLRGRSGRQGDPGSSRFYLSLDDNLMKIFGDPARMKALLSRVGMKAGEAIESALLTRQIERAQRKVEAYNFDLRKNLLEYDDVANDQRKVIYGQRNELMAAEDIADTIAALRAEVVNGLVLQAVPPESIEDHWNLPTLQATLARDFALEFDVVGWMAEDRSRGARELEAHVLDLLEAAYAAKETQVGAPDLRRIERTLMLQMVDSHWREHLGAMDYMRQGIFLRSYAQKNPKQEYKREAFEMFSGMLERIKFAVVTLLSRMQVRSEAEIEAEEAERQARLARAMQFQHAAPPTADLGVDPALAAAGGQPAAPAQPSQAAGPATFQRALPKVGRNDPCPCGSGRKYKQCHGQLTADDTPAFAPDIGRNDPCPCGSGQKYKHCHGKIEG